MLTTRLENSLDSLWREQGIYRSYRSRSKTRSDSSAPICKFPPDPSVFGVKTLIVELLVEEMPPNALSKLGGTFASEIHLALGDNGLVGPDVVTTFFATPRRLVALISSVVKQGQDRAL